MSTTTTTTTTSFPSFYISWESFALLRWYLFLAFFALVAGAWLLYLLLYLLAPYPRAPSRLEKLYRTIEPSGDISGYETLPCWHDSWVVAKTAALKHAREKARAAAYGKKRPGGWAQGEGEGVKVDVGAVGMERAEVAMSLVVPAFNEEERLGRMLGEAVEVLEREYGDGDGEGEGAFERGEMKEGGAGVKRRKGGGPDSSTGGETNGYVKDGDKQVKGWEVLVVSDGSTDKTIDTALAFAKGLAKEQRGRIRVVQLGENRGKGGAVTHGMRHVRGQYVVFADADGASRFEDLGTLVQRCQDIEDSRGRGVAVGSRAHLVGSEAVVQRSFLRNLLMHSFHLLLRLLTPPKTAAVRDTQCGFKLFSRASLPYIIPYMHSEGWIFDVEMLMLAESAGIKVVEVPVGWKEVKGSKLNVLWDSLGMAWGLAVLRGAWGLGIYEQT